MADYLETSNRILAELEEAGEENAASLLNTVVDPTGSERELSAFDEAVAFLIGERLVELELEESGAESKSVGFHELKSTGGVAQYLRFEEENRRWTFANPRIPTLVATDKGLEQAESLLREKGYQWWRNR